MKERITQAIFSSPTGVSIAIGVAGFLSALVTLFWNTSDQLSVKWLLFVLWFFLTFVIILFKLMFDLATENKFAPPYETPIKFIENERILLIRRNEHFVNQIVVGCYSNIDYVERLLSLGSVHIVQEQFIQIKLIPAASLDETGIESGTDIKKILVRPVVPLSALQAHLMKDI